MRAKVLDFCRSEGLFFPGERVLCALSGGADSVALLSVLLELREELQISVEAAHFHHPAQIRDRLGALPFRHRLAGYAELFAQRLYDQHEFSRFFMTEIWREGRVWSRDMRSKTQRLVDVVAEQFARGQREGAVAAEVDPTFEAVAVMGALLTATEYYMGPEGAPSIARQDFVRKIIDFTHRSVAPLP